ncbi:MAG: hypothetical protein ABFD82_09990 [Syntrophaceae bacterium]
MKTENIIELLDRINDKYPLRYTIKENMVHFSIEGITDEFRVSVLGDECIVSTAEWHEHFSTLEEMESFMKCLFTGCAEIIVTYRKDKPVSHRTQMIEDGKPKVLSRTGSLFFPFWRPKTERKLNYRIASKPLKPSTKGGS